MRTVFNLLGPLTNPAGAGRQLIGVSSPAFLDIVAGALALLGVQHALVVCSEDGLDEISASAATRIVEVRGEELRSYPLAPADVGIQPAPQEFHGGSPAENAEVTRSVLAGEAAPSAAELALINAGAAIYVAGRPLRSPRESSAQGRPSRKAMPRPRWRLIAASRKHAPAGAPA